MSSSDITASNVPPVVNNQPFGSQQSPRQGPQPASDHRVKAGRQHPDTTPSPDRILLGKLSNANHQVQYVARQIREVDKTINLVGENVRKMKSALEDVVKNYPPFPPGSSERIQALRQFAALRKQIDQLTVPPPDDSPSRILGDAEVFANAGDWRLPSSGSSDELVIKHQPAHPGVDGLNLPSLNADTPDDELHAAIAKIEQAQKTLHHRHAGFVSDANRVLAAML